MMGGESPVGFSGLQLWPPYLGTSLVEGVVFRPIRVAGLLASLGNCSFYCLKF